MKGKIKGLVPFRGFGFIWGEDGEDIYFQRSALRGKDFDALQEGTSVEFKFTRGLKGPRAVRVIVSK